MISIDAIHVRIRDGAVANRPIYVAPAVTVEGRRDILGLWAGDGGEGAEHWMHILTEIKNRGVDDVLMLVCDGFKGLPEAVGTIVRTCVVRLLQNSLRYVACQDWDKIANLLKPPSAPASSDREAVEERRRAGRTQVCLHGDHVPRRPGKGQARWTRHHLRRPPVSGPPATSTSLVAHSFDSTAPRVTSVRSWTAGNVDSMGFAFRR